MQGSTPRHTTLTSITGKTDSCPPFILQLLLVSRVLNREALLSTYSHYLNDVLQMYFVFSLQTDTEVLKRTEPAEVTIQILLTLYNTIMTFNDPEKESF